MKNMVLFFSCGLLFISGCGRANPETGLNPANASNKLVKTRGPHPDSFDVENPDSFDVKMPKGFQDKIKKAKEKIKENLEFLDKTDWDEVTNVSNGKEAQYDLALQLLRVADSPELNDRDHSVEVAFLWMSIAAINGHQEAQLKLPELEARLTPEQLKRARDQAEQFVKAGGKIPGKIEDAGTPSGQ